ncbi:MAG: GAF domain-containing protein, partial [Candidatus Nanopelagicales bacterium]|nr:GAF domain-containing protein [Candidatus Nanopelagicales bacterium]
MIPPPLPADEAQRLAALQSLGILDTPPEERFDRLTRMARDVFDVPIALVSLVDDTRQWFKSSQGLAASETSREVSFCGHAILDDDVMVVPDARVDPRFADNPLVTGDPTIRFYAGAPLSTAGGQQVGTLCIIDSRPREWSPEQSRRLRELADVVQHELRQAEVIHQRQALQALAAATADADEGVRDMLLRSLALGCEFLKLPIGAISRVHGDQVEVLVAVGAQAQWAEGHTYPLTDIPGASGFTVDDFVVGTPSTDWLRTDDHWSWVQADVSFLSMPLMSKGELVGVLTFTADSPGVTHEFTDAHVDFIRLLSRWVGAGLRRWTLDAALIEQQRVSAVITRAQSSFITKHDRRETFEGLLEDILAMMGCEYGFIGEILHDEAGTRYLKNLALTNIAWNEETRQFYDMYAEDGLEFRNLDTLFGRTITDASVVIANDPANDDRRGGLPEGHPAMHAYLGLPLFSGGLIGMLALANKPGGFSQRDVDMLAPVLVTAAQFIDVYRTARQRREDAQVIARLSMVASQMLSGIIITDIDGHIEWANDAFTRITEYSHDELIGRRPREVLHGPDTDPQTVTAVFEAMTRREAFEVDLLAYRKSGAIVWVRLTANPLANEWGEPGGYMVMVADISELKAIERMKSGFASTVSHELRTPLTAITGSLALVASGIAGELPEESKRMIDIAHKNSERLGRLIDDLLDMDKLVEGKVRLDMQVCALMPAIDRAIDANQSYAQQFGVTLACIDRLEGVNVDIDVTRFEQVMSNLLSNAAKFSSEGAQVDIRVLSAAHPGFVRVEVVDRGRGIPESSHHLLFQKFSQVDSSDSRARGGTG